MCLETYPSPAGKSEGAGGDFAKDAATTLEDLRVYGLQAGFEPFLISGTLLGHVRDGAIIGWDKDIDVGVFGTQADLVKLGAHLSQSGQFQIRRIDFVDKRLRVRHWTKVDVDIFLHYREGEKVWHDGSVTRWWNSPFALKTIQFLGVEQFIPEDPERYLDENYGDWRKPDPHFDARYDTPNLEVTNADYRDSLLYFSLSDAVRKVKPVKIKRYKAMISAIDPHKEWLDRVGG
jgi:hypothetical protein